MQTRLDTRTALSLLVLVTLMTLGPALLPASAASPAASGAGDAWIEGRRAARALATELLDPALCRSSEGVRAVWTQEALHAVGASEAMLARTQALQADLAWARSMLQGERDAETCLQGTHEAAIDRLTEVLAPAFVGGARAERGPGPA